MRRLWLSARRSASASPGVKPAATTASRIACSWKSGTPSVFSRMCSHLVARGTSPPPARRAGGGRGGPCRPRIGPGADDGDLDDEVVEAPRLQPGQHVHLRAALHLEDADRVRLARAFVDRRVLAGDGGQVERRALVLPRSARRTCESTVSMPRPRRSTLKMPRAFRSSLSHWTTVRSFIAAFSTGTTSASSPWVMTKPPTWMERCRGKPSSMLGQREGPLHARVLGTEPRLRPRARRSGCCVPASSACLASRSTWSSESPSALPTSRTASRPR